MARDQLEHVIRAAAIAGVEDVEVIGSQSVLGQFPDAPGELLISGHLEVCHGARKGFEFYRPVTRKRHPWQRCAMG